MLIWWNALDASAQAAWAQFAATGIGLAIAISVPWATHRAARRERIRREQDRARDVALAILDDVRLMRDRCAQLFHCLSDALPDTIRTPLVSDGIPTEDYLFVPRSLEDRASELHALGDAAKPVQHMLLLYRELTQDVSSALIVKALKINPDVHALRLQIRVVWASAQFAYAAIFALFSEVRPGGPEAEFIEPPIPSKILEELLNPPKPPGF